MVENQELSFVCNLDAMSAEERMRHDELARQIFGAVEERRELPHGYAFRLANQISLADAAEWADLESKCCPFFDFVLKRSRHGPVWLELSGQRGIKEFIRAELNLS